MRTIGTGTYSLVGIDTCAFSEIVRERHGAKEGFLRLFADGAHVPCFSVYSLIELRRRPEIYEQFVQFFDVFPCAILKNEDMLIESEVAAYQDPGSVDPLLLGFSVLNTSKGTNLRSLMELVLDQPEMRQKEADWLRLRQDVLDSWVELKPNYEPRGDRFRPADGHEFVELVTLSQVIERQMDWARREIRAGRIIQTSSFRSLRMMLWTQFFRVYLADRRAPNVQDVFDVLISAPAPYLDAVVTENFQADIYRQVMKLDPIVGDLDVYTMKDLQTQGRHA